MATWNSTPSVPHTGGTFSFPQNTTSNDIVYTIKYTDDNGCTASTTYTVPTCDCSVYEFSTITTPLNVHVTTPIAWSIDSLEQLTYTIMSSGGFLTGITIVHASDRWQYMGVFNTTTSTSDRTATIEYRNGNGTCVFTQQLVMKGETDCSAYDFNVEEDYFDPDATESDIASTTSSMPQLTATVKSGFITNPITVRMDGDYYYYNATFSENTGNPFNRSAVIEFTDGQGCVFSEDVEQAGIGCANYYDFTKKASEVSSDDDRYLIATSNASMAALTPTIAEGSSFLTKVEASASGTKYKYYGYFNENTSTSDRTAVIDYEGEEGCVIRQTVKQKGKEAPQNSIIVKKRIERWPTDSSCVGNLVEDDSLIVSCTFKITQSGYHYYTKNVSYVYDNLNNSTISIPLIYEGVNVESVYITELTFGGTTPYVYVYECGGDETRPLLLRGVEGGRIQDNILYYEKLDYERVCVDPIGGSPCTDLDSLYTSFELRYDDSKGIYTIYMDNSTSPTT